MIFGEHDEKTKAQLADVALRAERVALMADGHLGYVMPIGGVAAYRNKVSVVGVGFDIACGNCAIRTDLDASKITPYVEELANEIASSLSFGVGRTNTSDDAPDDHYLFTSPAWDLIPRKHSGNLKSKARAQLGTVGSGNHYVDVFRDNLNRVWVGVHFGSRGLGHTIASGFMSLAQGLPWETRVPETEVLFDLASPLGADYWELMQLAGTYAYAGREWVTRKVVKILGGEEKEMIHNHHNFAWKEDHSTLDGIEELVVVRKGATPAFPGQKGFVGGSMGDDSVILRGATNGNLSLQEEAMFSTVHGAGRVMSRTAAAGRYKGWGEKRHKVSDGLVSPAMMKEWIEREGVVLRGGGLDESPHAYRRLPDVLAAQAGTVDVLHVLHPMIVCMAGANEFDPYKD